MRYFSKSGSIISQTGEISLLRGLVQDSEFACRVKRVKRVTRRWARDPQKPFKGSFNVRIPTDLHRKAAAKATMMGVSLNQLVQKALEEKVAV